MIGKRYKGFSAMACVLLMGAMAVGCSADRKAAPAEVPAPTPTVEAAPVQVAAAPVEVTPPAPAAPETNWRYREDEDQMTSKVTKFASMTSDNELSLGFPYNNGTNWGHLTVRKHPQYGTDVMVSVSQGQMMCQSYQDCTITVRFDDDKPQRWSAVGPEDNSSEVVFLRNEAKFIERAKKAKRILIGIPFYQNGTQVLEFNTPVTLEWGSKAKTS